MSSIEAVIQEARAILAKKHGSSPDGINIIVNTLAQLFLQQYYEQYQPSRFPLAEIQKYLQSYSGLSSNNAEVNLNPNNNLALLQLIKSAVQEQKQTATDDSISNTYSNLLALLTKHNKATGVFSTPQSITRFMAEIVNPQPKDEQIYDPACGTCSLLVAAYTKMYPKGNKEPIENRFLGCEIDKNILPLGIMNMSLHDIDISDILCRDALAPSSQDLFNQSNTSNSSQNFNYRPMQDIDIILTHPPHGHFINSWSRQKLASYDSWFLQHCMEALKQNGRCAIVVSDRTLSALQTENIKLRRELFTKFNIQLLIGLPPNTFGELSGIKTYLLFFTRGQATQRTLRYELPNIRGPVTYRDLQPILGIWETWKNHLEGNAQLPALSKGFWVDTHDDLHQAEQLREIGEITKNPYRLYSPGPTQDDSPPTDPRELVSHILQDTQEIHDLALELQVLLDQKECIQ